MLYFNSGDNEVAVKKKGETTFFIFCYTNESWAFPSLSDITNLIYVSYNVLRTTPFTASVGLHLVSCEARYCGKC
jgi:hypothetical protein